MAEEQIGLHQLGLQVTAEVGLGENPTRVCVTCGKTGVADDTGEEQLLLSAPLTLWELRGDNAWVEQARVQYIAKAVATSLNSGGDAAILTSLVSQLIGLVGDMFAPLELVNWQTVDSTRYAVTEPDDVYIFDVCPGQSTSVLLRSHYDRFAEVCLLGDDSTDAARDDME